MKIKRTTTLLSLAAALAVTSCGNDSSTESNTVAELSSDGLDAVILSSAPNDAKSITEVRQDIIAGKEVVIEGKVMGRMQPFVDSRAIVVIGDPAKITSCDLMPDDHCTTPWDVCCDDPETIKKSIAIIQVVDGEGELIAQGLKGVDDIKELSNLIVTGTIAQGSSAENLLINATGIYHVK